MRKSLIVTLLLAAIALGGLCYAHAAVNAQKDAVVITETTVAGDPAAAEGICVQLRTKLAGHLLWETNYAAGAPDGTYTDFTFSRQRLQDWEGSYTGLTLYTICNSGYGGSLEETVDESMHPQIKLFRDVASRLGNASERTETLNLRDYYEYYPLEGYLDLPVLQKNGGTPLVGEYEPVCSFFRIPVPDDARATITVRGDSETQSYDCSVNLTGGAWDLWTSSVVAGDDTVYFTLNFRTEAGDVVDTSQIPGGVGIYRMSVAEEPVSLETVFPLDPADEVCDLHLSADGRRLLLITLEDDTCYLTVIDLETMTALQKLPALEHLENSGFSEANYEDDFLVVQFHSEPAKQYRDEDGTEWVHFDAEPQHPFAVITAPETGDYAVALQGNLNTDDNAWQSYYTAMDFNGDALVIAGAWQEEIAPRGFCLSVYGADGLRYSGRYASSLMSGGSEDMVSSNYTCMFTDVSPLTVCMPDA